jgi:hypothetical protein
MPTNLNELKQISDILDEREKDLTKREIRVADKEKTLSAAFKEFKNLVNKLENG